MTKTCFLIGPLGDEGSEIRAHSDLLMEVVTPTLEMYDYSVVRADRIVAASGIITTDIVQLLHNAELVIADLTGLNPNVFYELGVRHAIGKPFIQMIRRDEPIPFDIASVRTVMFDLSTPKTVLAANKTLRSFIEAIDQDLDANYSPIKVADTKEQIFDEVRRQNDSVHASLSATEAAIVDSVRGVERRLEQIEEQMKRVGQPELSDAKKRSLRSRKVFIVHGHDGELKEQVARLLDNLKFTPIILHEQPDLGQTIIEKLSANTEDIGFAFVLLTPDDVGAVKGNADKLNPRARQNVVFEHGLFVSHLGRNRVCALLKGGVELPSDLSGVIYKKIPDDGGLSAIKFDLVNELRAAGYDADANLLLHAK